MTDSLEPPLQNRPAYYSSSFPSQPLADNDLHIWRATLDRSREEISGYFNLLSPEEKARSERFYFERDCDRYIVGRGILRTLLSRYLGIEASRIEFVYGPHGKPAVATDSRDKLLQFNLSHSNDQALYIFGWDHSVGIDLEYICPMQDADDFAAQFYSARETALINSLSDDQKWDAFFKLWTCKEAFLKANGSGLSAPLDEVEISLDVDGSARLTSIGGDSEQAANWRLETINTVVGYQAAVAVEGQGGQVLKLSFLPKGHTVPAVGAGAASGRCERTLRASRSSSRRTG
jgi:4'-phosphopantetheinyl transferase